MCHTTKIFGLLTYSVITFDVRRTQRVPTHVYNTPHTPPVKKSGTAADLVSTTAANMDGALTIPIL